MGLYLSKLEKIHPLVEYAADIAVDITDFNARQKKFQDEIAKQLAGKGHTFFFHRIAPLAKDEAGDWYEVEWHETGIIEGVRVYFHINPVPIVLLVVLGAIAVAAVAVSLAIVVTGIFIVKPVKKLLTDPTFIIGAIIVALIVFVFAKQRTS